MASMELLRCSLLGFLATSLMGCGTWCANVGCEGDDTGGPGSGGDDGSTTANPGGATTTTTSWIEPLENGCSKGDGAECAKYLNEVYMSYDETNPKGSALGVPIRGRSNADEAWYVCSHECFNATGTAYPDCYVAASLVNHKVMLTQENTMKQVMDYEVYVIIQPVTAMEKLVKCAWQYDGAAFGRNNGGCGNGAPVIQDCDSELSPFGDKCEDDHSKYADENCQSTMRIWCGTTETTYPELCFWKGPAWYSPVYPGAEADMSRLNEENEIHKMIAQRLKSQSFDAKTGDQIPLTEYWNEVTMDGRIIDKIMKQDPTKVVAAFGYIKGSASAHSAAKQFRHSLKSETGKTVPIISIDLKADIGPDGVGPFGTEEGSSIMQAFV